MPELCPRCKHQLDLISTAGPFHRPAGPDFFVCLGCKTNWPPEELAEAKADQATDDAEPNPYADVAEVFYLESSRGEKGGGSNGCKMRKKSSPRSFGRSGVDNDWNVGEATEYAKKSRPIKSETLSKPLSIYFKAPEASALRDLSERSGVAMGEVIRLAVEKKLEKYSESA